MDTMVTTENLTKQFTLSKKQKKASNKNTKIAVNNISFNVNKGEIFGLLGPNGAGKTTTLRMLSALIKPTSGALYLDGTSITDHPMIARTKLTFLTNELKLDKHFTPQSTIMYFGRLRGLTDTLIQSRADTLFNTFGINEFAHTKIDKLSTGMKQKTSIAVSLIHNPELIIFDEPTSGLDIITARSIIDYLLAQKKQGKTIIISSHYMHIAEKLCDRMALMMNGQIKAEGTLNDVISQAHASTLEEAFFHFYDKEVTHA